MLVLRKLPLYFDDIIIKSLIPFSTHFSVTVIAYFMTYFRFKLLPQHKLGTLCLAIRFYNLTKMKMSLHLTQ